MPSCSVHEYTVLIFELLVTRNSLEAITFLLESLKKPTSIHIMRTSIGAKTKFDYCLKVSKM